MHEEIFRALDAEATLVTFNQRLARLFRRDFHARQRQLGRAVWRTPDILPLDAFLERAWRDQLWRSPNGGRVLLSDCQQQILWEQIIRQSPAGETLLRVPETARVACDTWRLVLAYRLPLDGRFEAGDDWSAFAAWAREFQKRCASGRWLERARLCDAVGSAFRTGEIPRSKELYVAGFDEITPQQAELFAALGELVSIEAPRHHAAVKQWKFEDAGSEIAAAAIWARGLIEQNAEIQIGVVVPDLARSRAKVERIFRQVLDPSSKFADQPACFHVSLGAPLAEAPVIHAALLALEFGLRGLTLPAAGTLLRSPFLGGFDSEASRRALFDVRLRRNSVWNVTVPALLDQDSGCPILQRNLARFGKLLQPLPRVQRPSEWSRGLTKLIEAVGWPGDRALNSREYQALEAWRECLSTLASLDLACRRIDFDEALSRLREIASSKPFQVENEGAAIQVLGALEASGLSFDHLWITGLHDEAMPSPAAPNPFLPSSLQREYKLPHSCAGQELEFAKALMARLLASAPDVVLSYPASEGDRVLTPSPLFAREWAPAASEATPVEQWVGRMRSNAVIDESVDEMAPPVMLGSEQRGGASLFKDMAACPFRAFAKHRLSARPLEETSPGLSYMDRGNTVHRALQIIWSELGSQPELIRMSAAQLQTLIARAARDAVEAIPHAIGRTLEQRRLEKLLWDWLEIEKTRPPFKVHATEIEREVAIGGLQIKTRADRIDELVSGGDIILDYKTGRLKSNAWDTDRLAEPQVPLYCATSDRRVAGAAFAQIRAGDVGFLGLAEDAGVLSMSKMRMEDRLPFTRQVDRWRDVLTRLADTFRGGCAHVEPRPDACEHCGLWALCRVGESRR